MKSTIKLSSVWWEPINHQRSHSDVYRIGGTEGKKAVERIALISDGRGPMGWYDCIHVYFSNKKPGALKKTTELVFPAYSVAGWEILPSAD